MAPAHGKPKRSKKLPRKDGKQIELAEPTKERIEEEGTPLTATELQSVQNRLRLRAAVIYEVIREEGEEELSRSAMSLWWSGFAAGVAIGFSVVAEGLLHQFLPDAPWRPLIENFGYCVGFIIVIMARQQLFTENTITVILPLLADFNRGNFLGIARLWTLVLFANIAGSFLFAVILASGVFFSPESTQAFREVSSALLHLTPLDALLRGMIAGWLIATLVWLLPAAERAQLWVVILITYFIALGDLTHVIAGSTEAFILSLRGELGWMTGLFSFFIPTLIGNIIGGTALFSLVAYAQVKEEL